MAKNYPWEYDSTADNNSDVGGINIAENCNFGNMNDAVRELMSHKAAELSEATLASASASDMATTAAECVNITGTTTITSFGTVKAGVSKLIRFAGALQLTHNATSFILPGGANITTVAGDTAIFITPGYRFRAVDGLMTNFHLPKSTLMMLVSALMGRDRMMAAYAHAIAREYRFYSYGDSSLLLP